MSPELVFFDNKKAKQIILINNNGYLRFRSETVKNLNIKKGELFAVSNIVVESNNNRTFYVVRTKDKKIGYRVYSSSPRNAYIKVKNIIDILGITLPRKLRYEAYKKEGREGIKIIL